MELIKNSRSVLFGGISPEELEIMLGCIGYHQNRYEKGEIIAFEAENIRHIGIVLSGAVDMIKEDIWGNRTMLVRMRKGELFGETFVCGADNMSVVTFAASENSSLLFLPFDRVMKSCSNTCVFHQRLIENMVRAIAAKNLELMRKVEVVSKKNLREKILGYLSQQAQLHDSRYFEVPLGRIEMADYLCTDRSALTRELSKMRDEGIIDYDKNTFKIL